MRAASRQLHQLWRIPHTSYTGPNARQLNQTLTLPYIHPKHSNSPFKSKGLQSPEANKHRRRSPQPTARSSDPLPNQFPTPWRPRRKPLTQSLSRNAIHNAWRARIRLGPHPGHGHAATAHTQPASRSSTSKVPGIKPQLYDFRRSDSLIIRACRPYHPAHLRPCQMYQHPIWAEWQGSGSPMKAAGGAGGPDAVL